MKIEKMLTPMKISNLQCRPDRTLTPTSVTIHNTANATADAKQHAKAQSTGQLASMTMAVHYYADDTETVYQCLDDTQQGWHAGDNSVPTGGNQTSIGIEVCEQKGINQRKAFENAAWLVGELCKKYGWGIANVKRHKDWLSPKYPTGKDCPHILLKGTDGMTWDWFLGLVKQQLQPVSKKVAAAGAEAVVNVTTTLSLRDKADSSGKELAKLTAGTSLYVISRSGAWAEVVVWQNNSYLYGWCAWQYLAGK